MRGYLLTLLCAVIGVHVAEVLWRSLVFASWPPANPNDPYGLGDILEAVLILGCLVLSAFSLLVAIAALFQDRIYRRLAILVACTSIILPVLYFLGHQYIPIYKL